MEKTYTIEEAAAQLRQWAELTAQNSQDWANYEQILLSFLRSVQSFTRAEQRAQIQAAVVKRDNLIAALAEVKQELSDAQVCLPPDAERILRENLWQLYVE